MADVNSCGSPGKRKGVLRTMPAPSLAKSKKVVGPWWCAMTASERSSTTACDGTRQLPSLRSSANIARRSRPARMATTKCQNFTIRSGLRTSLSQIDSPAWLIFCCEECQDTIMLLSLAQTCFIKKNAAI